MRQHHFQGNGVWALLGVLSLLIIDRSPAWSASPPPTITLVDRTLTVTFGPEDDVVRFAHDPDTGRILLQTDPNNTMQLGDPITANGKPVLLDEVTTFIIDLGAGNDKLIEPQVRTEDMWIYGGPGDDKIKVPLGRGVSHVYGGPGDDKINAEHAQTNFLYGEEGNDSIDGSADGDNLIDGGPGENNLTAHPKLMLVDPYRDPDTVVDTIVHHQGAHDTIRDSGEANVIYKFIGDPDSPVGGFVSIAETGGYDVLDFSAWNHPTPVEIDSEFLILESANEAGDILLKLWLIDGGIEEVIPFIPSEEPDTQRDDDPNAKYADEVDEREVDGGLQANRQPTEPTPRASQDAPDPKQQPEDSSFDTEDASSSGCSATGARTIFFNGFWLIALFLDRVLPTRRRKDARVLKERR